MICSFGLSRDDLPLSQIQGPRRESGVLMGMMALMRTGLTSTVEYVVTPADTSASLLSGDLPVLGTPRLLAWMESATCAAIEDAVPPGQTSVGTRVSIEHRAASAVGSHVAVTATLQHVDGRLLRFEVLAQDAHTSIVLGHGEITRVIVDRDRFLARVTG